MPSTSVPAPVVAAAAIVRAAGGSALAPARERVQTVPTPSLLHTTRTHTDKYSFRRHVWPKTPASVVVSRTSIGGYRSKIGSNLPKLGHTVLILAKPDYFLRGSGKVQEELGSTAVELAKTSAEFGAKVAGIRPQLADFASLAERGRNLGSVKFDRRGTKLVEFGPHPTHSD